MFAVIRKILFEKRFSLLAWGVGALVMVWLTLILYPSFSQGDQLNDLVKSLPPKLQGLVGNVNDFKSLGGYIDGVVFSLRVPLVTVTMAILYGISLTATDEEQGTMATLLAQPISRSRVLLEKFIALNLSIFIVHIGVFFGLLIALLNIGYSYDIALLLAITAGSYILALIFGSLAFMLGAALGKKGTASTIVAALTFLSFLVESLAPSVRSLQGIQKISPFYYYNSPGIASNGLDWSFVTLQAAVVIVFLAIAWGIFRHRDIEV